MKMKTYKLPFLKAGDAISVIAPSSGFDENALALGIKELERCGYLIKKSKNIISSPPTNYLSAPDRVRFADLIAALLDKDTKAIMMARGGYGTMRFLPELIRYKNQLKKIRKIVIGYSDFTPVLNFLVKECGWVCFYGPCVAKDLAPDGHPEILKNIFATLSGQMPHSIILNEAQVINKGHAEGVLAGGCLTLICSTLGTKFESQFKNKIILLEDVNESPYKIDRMLTQLRLAKKFDGCKAILFGSLEDGKNPSQDYTWAIKNTVGDLNIPILTHISFGHLPNTISRRIIPLGVTAQVSTRPAKIDYLTRWMPC